MPISYVAPSPVANEATMSGLLSRLQNARSGGGYGGGGGGGGAPGGWGSIVQLHDPTAELENRKQLMAMSGANAEANTVLEGETRAYLQGQAADLDAWQFNQKVTAQEAAQLRADQRAISAIDQDPTLSAKEKIQAKTMIRTRVDWVGQRQQRDLHQAQMEQYQQHAQQYKMQSELEESRLRYATQSIEGKLSRIVNPATEETYKNNIRRWKPELEKANPEEFKRLVQEEAARNGDVITVATKPNGQFDPLTADWGHPKEKGSSDRSVTRSGGESKPGPADLMEMYKTARELAIKAASSGMPNPPSAKDIMDEMRSVAAESQGGTKESKNADVAKIQADTTQSLENDLRALVPYLQERPKLGASPAEVEQFRINNVKANIMKGMIELYRKFPDPNSMPAGAQQEIAAARQQLDILKASAPKYQKFVAPVEDKPTPRYYGFDASRGTGY